MDDKDWVSVSNVRFCRGEPNAVGEIELPPGSTRFVSVRRVGEQVEFETDAGAFVGHATNDPSRPYTLVPKEL